MTQERLFISHAGEDAERANRIVAHLEARGVSCWIAPRDIPLKSVYAEEITRALQTCKACAVIVSASANASEAIKRELELASHYRRPFVPIRIDATEPGPGLDYYLRNTQWLDLRSNEQVALDRLVAHLKTPGAESATPAAETPTRSRPPAGSNRAPLLIGLAVLAVALAAGGVMFLQNRSAPTAPAEGFEEQSYAQLAGQLLTGDYNWDGLACGQGPVVTVEGEELVFTMTGVPTFRHSLQSGSAYTDPQHGVVARFDTTVTAPAERRGERYGLDFRRADGGEARLSVTSQGETDEWTRCTPAAVAPTTAPPPSAQPLINLADADTSWTGVWGDGAQLTWHLKADGRACHFYPHAGNREVCSWRWTQNGAQLSFDSGAEIWSGELSENGTVFTGQMGPASNPAQRQPFRFTRD